MITNPSKLLKISALGMMFCVLFVFSDTNMSSLYIIGTMGGSNVISHYGMVYYAYGNAMTVPLAIPVGKRIGQKTLLKICIVLFVFFIALSMCAPTYFCFVCIRLFAGCASGPIFILIPNILPTFVSEESKENFTKNVVYLVVGGTLLGSSFGAILAYFWIWRLMCFIDLFVAGTFGCLLFHSLKKYEEKNHYVPFDYIGYSFYCIAILSAASFITLGQQLDWLRSPYLCVCLPVALISLPYFVLHTWKHPYPILDLELLKNKNFTFAIFQLACFFSAYYGTIFLLGIWLHTMISYTFVWISFMIFIIFLSFLATSWFIHRMKGRYSITFMCIGLVLIIVASFLTCRFNLNLDFRRIVYSRILLGMSLPFFIPPVFYLVLHSVKNKEFIEGVAFFQLTRMLVGGIGAAAYMTIWQRRGAFFHTRLGGYLNVLNPELREFFHNLAYFQLSEEQKLKEMQNALNEQAIYLGLNDTFFCMGMVLVVAFFVALIFNISKKRDALLNTKNS